MDSHFFAALALLMVGPTLLGRMGGLGRLVPLVFLQLLFGGLLRVLSEEGWLQTHAAPLLDGPLAQSLRGLGWLGISLLIALTAAESAPAAHASRSRQFILISVLGFWSSFALGAVLSWHLAAAHPEWIGARADGAVFALGIGLALAVTALPVLVAILTEARLLDTPMGKLAANSAMLDDLWLWLGMAAVLMLARAGSVAPAQTALLLAAYLFVMLVPVRRLLARWLSHERLGAPGELLACVSLVFLSAMATDLIGVHAVFGIFVGGAVLPAGALQAYRAQLLQFTQVLLLPLFFVMTGLQLDLRMGEPAVWTLAAIFSAAGIGGKLLLVAGIARGLLGMPLRDSLALGSLMQCKGLMEIVAITMLRDAGIIGTQVFSALALTAVLSTAACLPLTRLALQGFKPRSAAAPSS